MKPFNKYVLISLCIATWIGHPYATQAQPAKRNLLSHFSKEDIAKSLIPVSQWHPFPQSAKEWQEILPDSVHEKIIKRAELYATMPFQPLPASLMMEYVRTGNRSNYQDTSFQKRERLFILALAESIEQKGRFINAVAVPAF